MTMLELFIIFVAVVILALAIQHHRRNATRKKAMAAWERQELARELALERKLRWERRSVIDRHFNSSPALSQHTVANKRADDDSGASIAPFVVHTTTMFHSGPSVPDYQADTSYCSTSSDYSSGSDSNGSSCSSD